LTGPIGRKYNRRIERAQGSCRPAVFFVLLAQAMPFIRSVKGLSPHQQFAIEKPITVLGRHPDCDVVLEVGAISRQHAQLLIEPGGYYVQDLGSRNGTYLNGQRVEGKQKLADNDEIKICDLVFSFHEKEPPPPGKDTVVEPTWATLVDDRDGGAGTSTIMSKIDVWSSGSGFRVTVNPEVKLKALIEISKDLAHSLAMDKVLPKILESLFKVFIQADRGFIVLVDGNGKPIPKAVRYRREGEQESIRISRTVVRQVMESKQAILSADAASDARFAMSESIADFRIRSMMCAPLITSEGTPLGVIQIDTLDQRSRFQEDDLEVLASVAAQAGFAIENARLHEKDLEQQAIERDLMLAREVQQGFLPEEPPQVPGYEFFQFYDAANQVGGDFFQYVTLPPGNRLAVFLGDVSGKGVSAALLMARLLAEARYCLASEATPAAAVSHLARAFSAMGWEDRFVTFLLAVVDIERHAVTLVNAGHIPPLLRHVDGTVETVGDEATGVPLGVEADYPYEQCTITLKPGESLTAFTDGFSEAADPGGNLFGLAELKKQVAAKGGGVRELGEHILQKVKMFVGGFKQSDDMCLICFGRSAKVDEDTDPAHGVSRTVSKGAASARDSKA
jgi:serine phosphatase RsbU (regulator of sigma subunit)/pSer/pThr/pTyr-binding forkhead associated (FHA) protein